MHKSNNTVDLPDEDLETSPSDAQLCAAQADNVREKSAAAFLYASMANTVGSSLGPDAFQAYRDQLLADAGHPHDPIEIMLVEATALAFCNVGRLHIKSATVNDHQIAIAFATAATKLTGELRRLALAVADYRAQASARLGIAEEDSNDISPDSKHVA